MRIKDLKVLGQFDLPQDATHTSGLAYSGEYLVALDFNSNKLYFLDPERSLADGTARVVFTVPTTLKGSSACAFFRHHGKAYLVVTDFRNTRTNYVLDYELLVSTRTFLPSVVAAYRNGGYSQGVVYKDGLILDANNTLLCYASLEVVALDDVLRGKPLRKAYILTPVVGIQDLEFFADRLYTSDESSMKYVSMDVDLERIRRVFAAPTVGF